MTRLKLTSVLSSLLVVAMVLGSLVVFGTTLVGNVPSMAVFVLVLVVFFILFTYGERFADGGTSYW